MKLDFVSKRFWLLLIPGILLVICLIAPFIFRPQWAVEFQSGSMMTVSFDQPVTDAQLKSALSDLGYSNALVQSTGDNFLIRTRQLSADEKNQLEAGLSEKLGKLNENEFYSVSPLVASETVRNAAIAVAIAAAGMLIYITWAFRKMPNPIRYGTCAIAALLHDVIIIIGIFSILGNIFSWEVDLLFITGVLAIIGYSINNVIVVFDRVRENASRGMSADFTVVVNNSLTQTLTRSLNTSITTVLAVLALLFFVGASIQNLAIVLLIGIVAGTFSSIFVAPLLLVVWEGAGWGLNQQALTAEKSRG